MLSNGISIVLEQYSVDSTYPNVIVYEIDDTLPGMTIPFMLSLEFRVYAVGKEPKECVLAMCIGNILRVEDYKSYEFFLDASNFFP